MSSLGPPPTLATPVATAWPWSAGTWALVGAPAALALAVLVAGIGSSSSGGHGDEGLYLQIVLDMRASGEWLTPTLNGGPAFFKPPLLYWMQLGAFRLWGPSLFAARAPVALCAFLLAAFVGGLARALTVSRTGDEARRAFVRGLLLTAGSLGIWRFGRLGMMDIPLCTAVAGAGLATVRARAESRPVLLLWAGLAAGLATLAKGPVGLVLCAGICGGDLLLHGKRLLRSPWPALATGVAFLVAGPWFWVMAHRHGDAFVDFFWHTEHLERFRQPWTLRGALTLPVSLLVLLLPWTGLVLDAWLRPGREAGQARRLGGVWLLTVLVVYLLPSPKFPHYVLAALPGALLPLCVRGAGPVGRRMTAAFLGVLGFLLLLLVRWPLPASALGAIAMAAALLALGARQAFRGEIAWAAAAFLGAELLINGWIQPVFSPPRPTTLLARAAADGKLISYGPYAPGQLAIETGASVVRSWNLEEVGEALRGGAVVVIDAADAAELPEAKGAETLVSWWRFRRRLSPRAVWDAWRAARIEGMQESVLALRGGSPVRSR